MKKRTVKKRRLRGVVRAATIPYPIRSYGPVELRFTSRGNPVLYGEL